MQDLDALRERMLHFGRHESPHASPLYSMLTLACADDEALLRIAAHAPASQPPANLFLGAVQYLLQQHDHALRAHYPSLGGTSGAESRAVGPFAEFARKHADEITHLLQTRLVQTNEVRRCVYLLPALVKIGLLAGGAPLALIEIGCSAGLNLLWDAYTYRYDFRASSLVAHAGVQDGDVLLTTELRRSTPAFAPLPAIAARIGIDLNILDVHHDDDVRWLRALVWPEHAERRRWLEAALDLARRNAVSPKPILLQGGATERWRTASLLPERDAALVVFHTHVFNQLGPALRAELEAKLAETSRGRPVFELGNDFAPSPDGGVTYELQLRLWRDGACQQTHLANVDGHGRYVEWLI